MTHDPNPVLADDNLPERYAGRNVVRIKLTVIIDQANRLLEWKVTGITGVPPRMTFLANHEGPTEYPGVHAQVMAEHLTRLLEEYCEPF